MIVLLSINIATIIWLSLGVIGIAISVVLLMSFSKMMKNIDESNTVPTMATIIDNKKSKDGAYAAVYRFKSGSTEHTVVGPYVSLTPYNIGVQEEITVNPANPWWNSIYARRMRKFMLILVLGAIGLSVFFLILGFNSL